MTTDPPASASSYREAGVDIDAGNETVRRIKSIARATFTPGVLSEIGSFGGLFRLDPRRYREPVLVASTDGVGTKLKIAFATGRHDTVGADLVNHCVNDILVQGAEPLFFLDYLGTGRLSPAIAEQIVAGMARGCRENGCALIGGETAEMPGFYAAGEYDIAGFIVGVVERSQIVDGRTIEPGDVLIGLPSAGLHTNGYSLARRVLFDVAGMTPDTFVPELGVTVGEALLAPHRSYLHAVRQLLDAGVVKGMAHITGGGITENLPRVLPEATAAEDRPADVGGAADIPAPAGAGPDRDRRDVQGVQHGHRADRDLRQGERRWRGRDPGAQLANAAVPGPGHLRRPRVRYVDGS